MQTVSFHSGASASGSDGTELFPRTINGSALHVLHFVCVFGPKVSIAIVRLTKTFKKKNIVPKLSRLV